MFQDGLARCHEVLGPEHPTTLRCMRRMVNALSNNREWESALNVGLACVPVHERIFGLESAHTLRCTLALALALFRTHDPMGAIELLEPCAETMLRVLGGNNKSTVRALHWLGHMFRQDHKHEDAIRAYQLCLEGIPQAFGSDTKWMYTTLYGAGVSLLELDRFAEACDAFSESFVLHRQLLGDEDRETLDAAHHLAYAYLVADEHQEAARICRDILAIKPHFALWTPLQILMHSDE